MAEFILGQSKLGDDYLGVDEGILPVGSIPSVILSVVPVWNVELELGGEG